MLYTASLIGKNAKTYSVEIVTSNDKTTTKELTLVAGGLVLSLKSSDNIFTPIKSTMATITVLTDDDLSDIYSASAHGTSVVIKEDDAVIFVGYVEPLKLSQPYAARKTEVEIVAIDAINSLQYIDFAEFGSSLPTFEEYLQQALANASPSLPLTLELAESYNVPLSEMAVGVGNWYDEDGVPSKWSEVVQHILLYLNMTLVMVGDKAIVGDISRAVEDDTKNLDIDGLSFRGSSISSSLTEVYNRLKVSASLYSDDDAIKELFDSELIEPVNGYGASKKVYKYDDTQKVCDYYTTFKQEGVMCLRNDEFGTLVSSENDYDIESIRQKVGAWLLRRTSVKWPSSYGDNMDGKRLLISDETTKSTLLINKLNSMIDGYNPTAFNKALNYEGRTLVKINDDNYRAFAGDYVLVLSADITYSPELYPYEASFLPTKLGDGKYKSMLNRSIDRFGARYNSSPESYIPMRLKIGDKYWANDNPINKDDMADGTWTTAVSTFKAYVAMDDNIRYHIDIFGEKKTSDDGMNVELYHQDEGEWLNNKSFIIRNNVRWDKGINAKGLMIPIKASDMLSGKIEFEILTPSSPYEGCVNYIMIDNLKLTIHRLSDDGLADVIGDDDNDDVMFENVADETSVKDGAEMTLKVASDAGRKFSRGAVVHVGESLSYVGAITSAISGNTLLAEEHIIERRVEQYKQPRTVLQGTLRNVVVDWSRGAKSANLEKTFVVAGATIDLDRSESDVKLIEIK